MKALILSDLHIDSTYYSSIFYVKKYKRILEDNIIGDYDIVIISGDVFEASIMKYKDINPFDILDTLFNGKPVIFCLGNHEFAYQNFPDVFEYWERMQKKSKNKNIHCIDVEDSVKLNGYNFVGNVFWYDWTMNQNKMLMQGEILDSWLDATIHNFDAMEENLVCRKKILKNSSKEFPNILVTHTVPYWKLNSFSFEDPYSPYNAYSGCKNFLVELNEFNFKFAFCGHTHRRELGVFENVDCYNIGNDYYFKTGKVVNQIVEL